MSVEEANNTDVVDFAAVAEDVERLTALVDEALLGLNSDGLVDVATGLGVRAGRLKTSTGLTKSNVQLLSEISGFLEKKCLETPEGAVQLLSNLHSDLVKSMSVESEKDDSAVTTDLESSVNKKDSVRKKNDQSKDSTKKKEEMKKNESKKDEDHTKSSESKKKEQEKEERKKADKKSTKDSDQKKSKKDEKSSEVKVKDQKKVKEAKKKKKYKKVSEEEQDTEIEDSEREESEQEDSEIESSEVEESEVENSDSNSESDKENKSVSFSASSNEISSESEDEEKKIKAEMQKLQEKLKKVKGKSEKKGAKKEKKQKPKSILKDRSLRSEDFKDLKKAWRVPLKIIGQFGKTNDANELISLKRQIVAARQKDPPYEDSEIVEAVIRSVTAGTHLRRFLETAPNLTLDLLVETLGSWYIEADEKDLLHELTTLRQKNDEDAQTFVMRGLDITHQIRSKKSSSKKISKSMVNEMLLESLETGFTSETMRNRMRPFLQDPSLDEKDLLRAVARAVKAERDRKSKFEKRTVKVNEISQPEDDDDVVMLDDNASVTKALIAEVRRFRGDLAKQQI